MQYVRSISGSVSKTWNSINPATLSGAIDVIVIEHDDGTLACSPFHVRFGKFSLLRPYEKKVEFTVNGVKQDYAMKLGEGGEAFFVFETTEEIPASLQTSPLVSPAASPRQRSDENLPASLQEPDFLDLERPGLGANVKRSFPMDILPGAAQSTPDLALTPLSRSPAESHLSRLHRGPLGDGPVPNHLDRSLSEVPLRSLPSGAVHGSGDGESEARERPRSPPPLSPEETKSRAITLSKKLSGSNIPAHVTETGDLMLDMTGYKSNEDDALRAEVIARKILAEELEGSYDIGALIGADEHGNLWIYSSEEAKEAANRRATLNAFRGTTGLSEDAVSDPGYHSEGEAGLEPTRAARHHRANSDVQVSSMPTPPHSPTQSVPSAGDPNRNYAKTLRLTSDQLKALNLKAGANPMSFSVNKATCTATMYKWSVHTPLVISDIDGTITKSDALGHVLNMIGRDWTHAGVAKLYTDIVNNGYNIMYLTSRSVGQADTTRAYLYGINQDGWKLPRGPVITSPDRTMAALRREIYLRKPEVFKMACLRDILGLYGGKENPFYAGFGNRLTDALSYRSVNIPPSRIFTINSNAEVSLDVLSLNKYKSSYVSMRELVDHFFPPVSMLVHSGGEDFTDFTYWRDTPQDLEDFSTTDSEDDEEIEEEEEEEEEEYEEEMSEDEGSDMLEDGVGEEDLAASYVSRDSVSRSNVAESVIESIEADEPIEPEAEVLRGADLAAEPGPDSLQLRTLTLTDTHDGVRDKPTERLSR